MKKKSEEVITKTVWQYSEPLPQETLELTNSQAGFKVMPTGYHYKEQGLELVGRRESAKIIHMIFFKF